MPFDRYQSVVDRQMFGPPPPGFDPTKSPNEVSAKDARDKEQELSKEQEQVKSSVHFSVINVTPSGETAVGFTDNGDSKNPVHYYLKVGESRDGWTVKEADPLAATMTIAKGDVEVSLELGGNSSGNANATKSRSGSSTASAMRGSGRTFGSSSSASDSGSLGSLRDRRARRDQLRQEAEKAAAEERAKQAEEREQEKLRREKDEADREEQRQQLLQMTEELRKMRESNKKEAAASKDGGESGGESGDENESENE